VELATYKKFSHFYCSSFPRPTTRDLPFTRKSSIRINLCFHFKKEGAFLHFHMHLEYALQIWGCCSKNPGVSFKLSGKDNANLPLDYFISLINPLNPELNPICYLLALLAHHFRHVSRIMVKSLTLRLLMSYIYGGHILDVSRPHTRTHHSR